MKSILGKCRYCGREDTLVCKNEACVDCFVEDYYTHKHQLPCLDKCETFEMKENNNANQSI